MRTAATFALVTLGLVGTFFASGCSKKPTRWDAAEKKVEQQAEAPKPEAPKVEGKKLNAFFPSEAKLGANYKTKFTAERDGYVEAQLLNKDGKVMGMLSISEVTDAKKLEEYSKSDSKVGTFPLLTPTKKKTNVLVGGRFQVSAVSEADALSADEQRKLVESFNLNGLKDFTGK
jgi:PBP1b-binding outer membrane lipoprotein LpoB